MSYFSNQYSSTGVTRIMVGHTVCFVAHEVGFYHMSDLLLYDTITINVLSASLNKFC